MSGRKRSLPRVEFRRALADWGGRAWVVLSRDYQSSNGDVCPSAFTFRLLDPAKIWLAERERKTA